MLLAATLLAAALLDAQHGSLQAAAQAFDDAQLHHDRRAIDSFLAPDFQYVTRKGLLRDRAAFLATTASPDETLEPFEVAITGCCRSAKTAASPAATPSCAGPNTASPSPTASAMPTCSPDGAAHGSWSIPRSPRRPRRR
jgi:hypothetical protein